jgi:hypothetical protein
VVDLAAREPQDIYRRDELVARVVAPDAAAAPRRPSPAELIANIRRVCADEDYELPVSPRTTRPNPFAPATKPPGKPTKARRRRGS